MTALFCPLCNSRHCQPYAQDKRRHYAQCGNCKLVFVEPAYLPDEQAELREYQLHENDPEDAGYRTFLMRIATPLLKQLGGHQYRGLDFGCGPTPLLANILGEQGHEVSLYDPFFYPDRDALQHQYDFITCSEAIEHFHQPAREVALWNTLIKPGGWLAIMTKRVISQARFIQWHYKNDPTHVSFFSDSTFEYIARTYGYSCKLVENDVVLMQKNR